MWEDCSANDKVVIHAEIYKTLTIFVSFTMSMSSHCPFAT